MSKQKTPREILVEKWDAVLNNTNAAKIEDDKKYIVAQMLENQQQLGKDESLLTEANEPNTSVTNGGVASFEPVLISLVRRMSPKLIAFDLAAVQTMKAPSQLIFALKSRYGSATGTEALHDEADTAYSGTGTHSGSDPTDAAMSTGTAMPTVDAEGDGHWQEMGFSIDEVTVTAQSRQLKASYSHEIAQNLKSVHGLDADAELSTILQTELISEINRQFIRTVYTSAKQGAQTATTAGTFDLNADSDGRWAVEKFKGLIFQIDRDANAIAVDTKRGKGNVIICSSDVASALVLAGVLDYAPELTKGGSLNIDPTGNTFVGRFRGIYKVYIDPYATQDFYLIGYRGASSFDAGIFYCPYVPLTRYDAVDSNTFQPVFGFKTRYGLTANPFTSLSAGQNVYYRKAKVVNIL